MAFAGIQIEFYQSPEHRSQFSEKVYPRLISSVNDATTTGTPEHAAIPGGTAIIRIIGAVDHWVEIGAGNQDVGATRKSFVPANSPVDFQVNNGDTTVSYTIT